MVRSFLDQFQRKQSHPIHIAIRSAFRNPEGEQLESAVVAAGLVPLPVEGDRQQRQAAILPGLRFLKQRQYQRRTVSVRVLAMKRERQRHPAVAVRAGVAEEERDERGVYRRADAIVQDRPDSKCRTVGGVVADAPGQDRGQEEALSTQSDRGFSKRQQQKRPLARIALGPRQGKQRLAAHEARRRSLVVPEPKQL